MLSNGYQKLAKLLAIPLLVLTTNTYAAQCNTKSLDSMFNLMAQRNSLMMGVAAYKYIKKSSIYDSKQELTVLQNSLNTADTYQLNADKLMVFVQIQMDLSKQIQSQLVEHWKAVPSDAPDPAITPDLSTLRGQIAAIDNKLYSQIAANVGNLKQCNKDTVLSQYTKAMQGIKGIPSDPDYNLIVIAALKNISK